MWPAVRRWLHGAAVAAVALLGSASSLADEIPVKHLEGLAHGFVAVRTLEGALLADGDLVENAVRISGGNRVTTRLTLRFKDGSIHEETTTYVQRKTFRFVSDHLVQKGPSFKTPLEARLDASGRVTIRYTDEGGKEKRIEEQLKLPPDVANGMILALLKNVSPDTPKTTVSMVAMTPEPRLVDLEFTPHGYEPFSTATSARKAMHYIVKVHVPGATGTIASLLGKTPSDSHVWILTGEAPAFVKAEMALFPGGPTWRIELLSPVWTSASSAAPPEALVRSASPDVDAKVTFPEASGSSIVSCSTSVQIRIPVKWPRASPATTAFPTLPIPDCSGSRFAGSRPCLTSNDSRPEDRFERRVRCHAAAPKRAISPRARSNLLRVHRER